MKWQVRDWRNNDFVRKHMFNNQIITENEHKGFLDGLQNSVNRKYYIAFFDGKPFGVLNTNIDSDGKKLEFGYYLTDIRYVDGGFGAILEYALLNHAFFSLNVKTVFCRVLTENKKVISLHKRFGFEIIMSDEEICFQSIGAERWKEKQKYIENIIGSILPISDIGRLC